MERLLRKLYYDPETGFGNADTLYRKAKSQNPKITQKFVKDWIAQQEVAQITKPIRKKKQKDKPITGPIGKWNVDLTFYPTYKKQNNGRNIW